MSNTCKLLRAVVATRAVVLVLVFIASGSTSGWSWSLEDSKEDGAIQFWQTSYRAVRRVIGVVRLTMPVLVASMAHGSSRSQAMQSRLLSGAIIVPITRTAATCR